MSDTAWVTTDSTTDPHSDCSVFAARLIVRSHHDIPGLLGWAAEVARQLGRAPGLLGYAIAPEPSVDTLWTVSAWSHRTDLLTFERSNVHQAAKQHLRGLLTPSTLAVWTCPADQLPIGWPDVRARITAIDATASNGPERRPGTAH